MIFSNNQLAYCHETEISDNKEFHHSTHVAPSSKQIYYLRDEYIKTHNTCSKDKSYFWPATNIQKDI